MTAMTHRRLATRGDSLDLPSWSEPPWSEAVPAGWAFPVFEFTFGVVALLCFAWWVASPHQVLVASARVEGGRVLVCQYFAGTRVIERQYFVAARGFDQHTCSLVRFG